MNKSRKGFTLLEVVAATSLTAVVLGTLITVMNHSLQTRVRMEARREAVIAAHTRCEMFARGLLYASNVSAMSPDQVQTFNVASPADLPGGFPVSALSETVTTGPAGSNSATISVHFVVETLQSAPCEVTSVATRYW